MTRVKGCKSIVACFLLVVSAGAMFGQNATVAPAQSTDVSQMAAPQPQLQQRYPRYKIQCQDVLLLSFPLSPEMNETATVQPDGYINLQNSASIHVAGFTVPELREAVKSAYVGTLHEPIINVDLEDFQKPLFTVTGQVGKPGQYELRTPITVAEAIAVAGGLQPTAKTQVFLFHRTSSDLYQVQKLNLKAVLNGKNVNEDPALQPGDMVFVPEKFIDKFKKYVPYAINAGTYISPTQF